MSSKWSAANGQQWTAEWRGARQAGKRRLRYFAEDRWSLAFYTYSNERYEPCVFHNGTFFGTPEEGLDVAAIYL